MRRKDFVVAVVGLGYVGLPLALAFSEIYQTIGFDISNIKVTNLRNFRDDTGEVSEHVLRERILNEDLIVTEDPSLLKTADFVIVAVPTPVRDGNIPDLRPLVDASVVIGRNMGRGVTVVYESTVYPGATEEVCIPILEKESKFKWKTDFHVGYSPERANPGDKRHTVRNVVKVVSGDESKTVEAISKLYGSIVKAGIFLAQSIKVAEAAKVIENTQRDLNIALINELSIIFKKLGIDTEDVLKAARTKWNFIDFKPGLVGGHCIGVDPYYLTFKAEQLGYCPEVILSGRRINDHMARYVAMEVISTVVKNNGGMVDGCVVVVIGVTFKENCRDVRNSKIFDLLSVLRDLGCRVFACDPLVNPRTVESEYGVSLTKFSDLPMADALILGVPHKDLLDLGLKKLTQCLRPGAVFADLRASFPRDDVKAEGFKLWRL